jgi:hypothetical protein
MTQVTENKELNTLNTPPSDAIVRKIQLLLNLASRTEGNEAEAAAAMAKAQDLLAQYNLDLATVTDKQVAGGTAAREADTKRDYARLNRSAMYKWQRNLVKQIAEANYCVYWVTEVTGPSHLDPKVIVTAKRHKVLGRVANTTVVMVMVDYLLDTLERLLPFPNSQRMSREANLWREGCADRLAERVRAKAEAQRTPDYATQGEAGYSTALAVRDLVKREEAGNYDAQYGTGAWARRLARQAEQDAAYAANAARWALEAEEERKRDAARLLAETPADKARRLKREAAEERANEAYSRRYWARADRQAAQADAKRNSAAYRAGRAKGDEVGLDSQVSAGKTTKGLA